LKEEWYFSTNRAYYKIWQL